MAEGFDDGVVLDELLGVRVGELDRTAPAEEVFRRSDGGAELGVDGVAPVRGQARDGTDVYVLEDARLVEEEGLDAARGAERGWERPRRCLGTISSIVPESGALITWTILKPRFAAAAATHAPVE